MNVTIAQNTKPQYRTIVRYFGGILVANSEEFNKVSLVGRCH
jgi:hypothetical protein